MTETKRTAAASALDGVITIGNIILALVIVVALFCVQVPFSPEMPQEGLDPSWRYAMNEAVAQGFAIGRDIVFTFGPYAALYSWIYHPGTDALVMTGGLYLAFCSAVATVLVFYGARWTVQIMLLIMLAILLYIRDPLFFFYALMLGTLCWKFARGEAVPIIGDRFHLPVLAVLFSGLSLLGQIKGSGLVISIGTVVFAIAMFAWFRKPTAILVSLGAFVIGFVGFWLFAGQEIGGAAVLSAGRKVHHVGLYRCDGRSRRSNARSSPMSLLRR